MQSLAGLRVLPCLTCPVLVAVCQANRKEVLSLTDKLMASEAEAELLRKQSSSLQSQLDAAQAKVSQQAATLSAVQEAQTKQQVGQGRNACTYALLGWHHCSCICVGCPCMLSAKHSGGLVHVSGVENTAHVGFCTPCYHTAGKDGRGKPCLHQQGD